jgi:excisionase family DNA binding protein
MFRAQGYGNGPRKSRRGESKMATQTQGTIADRTTESMVLSKSEAAQLLGVSLRTIDRLIALRQLQVRRFGRRVLIQRSVLQDLRRRDHPTQAAREFSRKIVNDRT